MTTSIVWFRRDLRLGDNPAWALGTRSDVVVPLFVIDPRLFDAVSASTEGGPVRFGVSGSGSAPRTRNR